MERFIFKLCQSQNLEVESSPLKEMIMGSLNKLPASPKACGLTHIPLLGNLPIGKKACLAAGIGLDTGKCMITEMMRLGKNRSRINLLVEKVVDEHFGDQEICEVIKQTRDFLNKKQSSNNQNSFHQNS